MLNAVDSLEAFSADVLNGNWERVLAATANLKLPVKKLINLYEQVALELAELGEVDSAHSILRQTSPMASLRERDAQRYVRLEQAVAHFNESAYAPLGRAARRQRIAQELRSEVLVVPPGRLLALLAKALRWDAQHSALPPGAYDLFAGRASAAPSTHSEHAVRTLLRTIRFGKRGHAECACFTPDGESLITGSYDGYIEVWDWRAGSISKAHAYQADDSFMRHESSVLCLDVSADSQYLASGSADGQLRVWQLRSGRCIRTLEKAHQEAITCVRFAPESSHVLSTSHDGTIRLHGLKSGRTLKIFRGHKSFVNSVLFTSDAQHLLSASSDGSVKLWDSKTTECTQTLTGAANTLPTIHSIALLPRTPDAVLVCARQPSLTLLSLNGAAPRSWPTNEQADLACCCVSPRGGFVMAVDEQSQMYCFSASGRIENTFKIAETQTTGICHHPTQSLVATWGPDGAIRLWVP